MKAPAIVVATSAAAAMFTVFIEVMFGELNSLYSRLVTGCLIFLLIGSLCSLQLALSRRWADAGIAGLFVGGLTALIWRFGLQFLDLIGLVEIVRIIPVNQ